MTLLELVKYLRSYILFDVGGHGIEWENIAEDDDEIVMLRWSNEELVEYIQQALYQVYRRILPAHGYYPELDVNVIAGEPTVDLDYRILNVLSASFENTDGTVVDLCMTDLQELERKHPNTLQELSRNGTPRNIIPDFTSGTLRMQPFFKLEMTEDTAIPTPGFVSTPVVKGKLKLLVERLPLKRLSWNASNRKVEIREELAIQMLNYAAYLAYSKDEANTADAGIAAARLRDFDKEFLQTSAYSDVRKRRAKRNYVRYGGY
jgi:hypothetical protein